MLPTLLFGLSSTWDEVTALASLVASPSISGHCYVSGQTNTKFAFYDEEQ